ncbi:unnamed protein product [Hymenolepis diminuta]|nr:unnamed protein product [Hymenolepis diminuta]
MARTPPMGWLTWQRFRCQNDCKAYPKDCISEDLIIRQAHALVNGGWLAKGYQYIIIDDCWSSYDRDPETSRLVPDPVRFPHGMKWLADRVHKLGLKFGIYLDFGDKTCAGYPGSLNYLEVDAKTMADWGVDFIKMDGCNSDLKIQADGYEKFGMYLNATMRPIVFGCSYPLFQHWRNGEYLNWTRLAQNCNLWRLLDDIQDSWASLKWIMSLYETYSHLLTPNAGPGHWNDLDMLLGGNFGLSLDETRVQMGMWAMHATLLILSTDLEVITDDMKKILQADLVIRVNQDAMGQPAKQLSSITGIQIWKRHLVDFNNGWALAFLHLSDETGFPKRVVLSLKDVEIPDRVSYKGGAKFKLTDAFTAEDVITVNSTEPFEVRINPSGIVMLIIEPIS